MKVIYKKPIANILLNWEKLKSIPVKSEKRQGCLLSPLLFNTVLKFLARVIKHEKEIKGIYIGKEEDKLPLFADNTILYLENPKHSTRKFLDLTNTFKNLAGYKINIQKSVDFLYTSNEQTEKEIRKTIPVIIALKIKYKLKLNQRGEKPLQ
jgi:hypothetical protein